MTVTLAMRPTYSRCGSSPRDCGASPNWLSTTVSSASGSLPVSRPFSLSWKAQRLTVSLPVSKRMPAPLPSGTRVPRNSMLSISTSPPRTTRMALPSACLPPARSTGRLPTPWMVSFFCVTTPTWPSYSPSITAMVSPSRAWASASRSVMAGALGPTTKVSASAAPAPRASNRVRLRRIQGSKAAVNKARSMGGILAALRRAPCGRVEILCNRP